MQTGTVSQVVGRTPLIKIHSLSEMTGCEIFGKAEHLNPGGSVKDRAARGIIDEAEKNGELRPGGLIVEGTAGNTGIGLATIAAQRGYRTVIVMPDNQAREKYDTIKALGAELITVPPTAFANEGHFYHTAKRVAGERPGAFWANQFENLANFRAHYATTGPELWEQTQGRLDAFIAAAGTGGTIAGVSRYLKEKNPKVHVRLADCEGSGLDSYLRTGQMTSVGTSISEGIGIMRLTANFKEARIDDSVRVTDQEMLAMIYHVAARDGLLVGTSAAINLFACYQYALKNRGARIVTVICDSALRYQSKVFNPAFLSEKGLTVTSISG